MSRYAELHPADLQSHWDSGAPAIVPFGALECHGAHLPLGLDGLVSEWFCEKLAERLEAVLLPCFYTPMTTLPHKDSLQVPTAAFRMIVDETINGLHRSGARRIALVTGHYAQGHEIELFQAALRAMDGHQDLFVFAGPPLGLLGDDALLDHAARWETAQLLAVRPELVRVEVLPEHPAGRRDAVLGDDPRLGTAAEGLDVLARGLSAWATALQDWTREELDRYYCARFDVYQAYVDQFYQGSWEDAILAWWDHVG